MIIGVDPGPTTSGLVVLTGDWPSTVRHADPAASLDTVREAVCLTARHACSLAVVVEWLTSYGTAVGASVLDTARVVGRIEEIAANVAGNCPHLGVAVHLVTRPEVALRLAGTRRATDAQVHEAVRAIYREAGLATGGGADPCRGTRAQPGPLHQVRSHAWDALAVALAWSRGA